MSRSAILRDGSAMPRDRSAMPRDRSAIPRDRSAMPRDRSAIPRDELAGTRVSVLGFGKVGESMAWWMHQVGFKVVYVSTRRRPAEDILHRLGARYRLPAELSTVGQDLLLLAVPDARLEELAGELATRPQASLVLHVSGSLGANVLAPLRENGSAIGALHPLRAFSEVSRHVDDAGGVFFALDGDAAAVSWGQRLVDVWQGEAARVDAASRTLYHAAATLAAGGVTTLLSVVDEMAAQLSLPSSAMRGYLALARGALAQAGEKPPGQAITGPAARGDTSTLEAHRRQLEHRMPHLLPLFDALTEATQQQMMRCHSEASTSGGAAIDEGLSEATESGRRRPFA